MAKINFLKFNFKPMKHFKFMKPMVKHFQKMMAPVFKKALPAAVIISMVATGLGGLIIAQKQPAKAAAPVNLIKEGDFEGSVGAYWAIWTNNAHRSYSLFRSYEAPFGYGSHSLAVEAQGAPEEIGTAGLALKNEASFAVESGKMYYLVFYAKTNSPATVSLTLENANTYEALALPQNLSLNNDWQKFVFIFTPQASSQAIISFAFGNMADGNIFYLDGIRFFLLQAQVATTEVKGYIGETNKFLRMYHIEYFSEDDIEVELPYFDNTTGQISSKRFHPTKRDGKGIYINMYPQTYSGVANVYIQGNLVGRFNYTVIPKLTGFIPSLFRAEQDVTISGSGFNPVENSTWVVITTIDVAGKKHETWLQPHTFDSALSQITVSLPYGIAAGRMYVQTSYTNTADENKTYRSNYLSYKVKPVINHIEWSQRGFDQVGDKMKIYGKGISDHPYVRFYDQQDNLVSTKRARVIEIYTDEVIEVDTPDNLNNLKATVMVSGIESDKAQAIAYLAKPRFNRIKTRHYRPLYNSGQNIQAAKNGEEITLEGEGFYYPGATTSVEFEGANGRFQTAIAPDKIDRHGRWLRVTVPEAARTGYLTVIVNGQHSNYLPLEIIPTVISISPEPIVPGQPITITVIGAGNNINLYKLYFKSGRTSNITVEPTAVNQNGSAVNVQAVAPLAISHNDTKVVVQYDHWLSDETSALTVPPHITNASIDMDTHILVIKGYGFSINPKEDVITYKYADEDHTVVNPKVRILGVYPTEEGQEIRVQIYDDYHYGYVTVTVADQVSNEVQFGPASIRSIARRIEYVKSENKVMGVLYISGYNFGDQGGVLVGTHWAQVHYRSNFFIIAVIDQQYLYDNPVIIARE